MRDSEYIAAREDIKILFRCSGDMAETVEPLLVDPIEAVNLTYTEACRDYDNITMSWRAARIGDGEDTQTVIINLFWMVCDTFDFY